MKGKIKFQFMELLDGRYGAAAPKGFSWEKLAKIFDF